MTQMNQMPGQPDDDMLRMMFAMLFQMKQSDPQRASLLEARLAEISAMSPEEQAVALADLTESYGPRRDDLRDELSQNYDTLTAAGPQGQVAGNNQFSVYVGANPLEHLASGINKYQAGKGMKQNRADLDILSTREAGAQQGVMGAMARAKPLSGALRDDQLSDREYFLKYGRNRSRSA